MDPLHSLLLACALLAGAGAGAGKTTPPSGAGGPKAPAAANPAAARKTLSWEASADLGAEYDSNANRLDAISVSELSRVQSGLLRGQGRLTLSWRPLKSLHLAGAYDLAGKVFFTDGARSQDALIQRLTLTAALRLGAGLLLRVHGLYHEGFQREASAAEDPAAGLFDFRVLDGRAQLALAPDPSLILGLAFGARRFTYKPNDVLSFEALLGTATLEGHWALGSGATESELDIVLGYSLAQRRFADQFEVACPAVHPNCPEASTGQLVTFPYPEGARRDVVQRLSFELTWVQKVLLKVGYEFTSSRSNSAGLSYRRHDLRARLVSPLFWKIYGTLQLRARILDFEPSVTLVYDPGFEEENRSHVLVQLERPIWKGLRVVLRYTLFVGDLRDPDVAQLRHLVYLGLAYRYRTR